MDVLFAQSIGIFIYCLLLAWLEVQIEGEAGWAANLPTWRRQPAWAKKDSRFFAFLRAAFRVTSGGNELTGYHLAMTLLVFCSLMLPVLMATPTLALFARCLGFFFLTLVTWDFLWFVLNPAFGVRRFNKQAIKWHPRWLGPVPAAYPFGYTFGAACVAYSAGSDWRTFVIAPLTVLVLVGACIAIVEARRVR
ncbi:MAG: hypothetical protein IT381_16430 [Deltaproteobacteria bacterium]|nr:hypothetical protein [Deltaproteobacteria bacterium]